MSDIASSGAGIHPGKPVIWPSSKPQEKPKESSQTAASQSSASTTSASTPAPAAQSPATQAPSKPIARSMALADIVEHLINIGVSNTAENKQLASFMMQHGVELSRNSFDQLFAMLKGQQGKNAMESAVVALSKGLENSLSMQMLMPYFAKELAMGSQLKGFQEGLARFQAALQTGRNALEPGIFSGLSQLLNSFDTQTQKLQKMLQSKNAQDMKLNLLTDDLATFSQFLSGLEHQFSASNPNHPLLNELAQLKKNVSDLLNGVVAQSILSKDTDKQLSQEKYFYWMIANPAGKGDVEVLIRKDAKKKAAIDEKKTRMVVKFETAELGEVVVTIDVLDNKVWYVFNTQTDEARQLIVQLNAELKDRLDALNFRLTGFQALQKKVDIRKFLLPTQNLDDVMRIHVEV